MKKINIIKIKGQPVLTTRQIAEAYETTTERIKLNYRYNKKRYIIGKHYIEVTGEDLAELKRTCEFHTDFKHARHLYLWTEKGALLHAKSINTDKAWEVYDYLVDYYFRTAAVVSQETAAVVPVPTKKREEVADVPDNAKIQSQIRELRKYTTGIDATLDTLDRYITAEEYKHITYVVQCMGYEIAHAAFLLNETVPKIIEKPL
ncbi:MAG: ORF6N domain-containing protein [bacterium]|nr:ORF6N domain-containing protein [bacterium]